MDIQNIRKIPVKRLSVNDKVITYAELSGFLDGLDNRLSDVVIETDDITTSNLTKKMQEIVKHFGGK